MIERCGDRQRKYDGLQKWAFHLIVESLPVMLQVALLFLVCGLCQRMEPINATIAHSLIAIAVLGGLLYLGIVIAGISSYDCPFQTPASSALYSLRKKLGPHILPIMQLGSRYTRLPTIQLDHLPQTLPLSAIPNTPLPNTPLWLEPEISAKLKSKNTNDIRCVLWILQCITDPEALEAAIRLSGMIQWFGDGLNLEPPYNLIISTLEACFDPSGKIYPGLRDRAYYSAQAIVWIHIRALCALPNLACRFPLPKTNYITTPLDPDLEDLLRVFICQNSSEILTQMYDTSPDLTPVYLEWTSNALLHLSWANRSAPDVLSSVRWHHHKRNYTISSHVFCNHLLASCIFLGWPVDEGVLKIQDVYVTYYFCPPSYLCCYLSVIALIRPYHSSP